MKFMRPSSNFPSLFTAYLILFLDNFGFSLVFPIFPYLFIHPKFDLLPPTTDLSVRNLLLGTILAIFPIGQFFGAPYFGSLADHFGRKKALYWTLAGTVVGYFLTAISIHLKLLYLLFLARLITGFFAGNLAISMAIIADLHREEKARGRYMSFVAALLGASWILSIIYGASYTNPKDELFNPAMPFWVTGVLSLLSIGFLAMFYRETFQKKSKKRLEPFEGVKNFLNILKSKKLLMLYFTFFFWFFGFFISLQWIAPVSIEEFRATEVNVMWVLLAFGIFWTLASAVLNPWMITWISLWTLNLWSLFFTMLLFLLAALSPTFPYFLISYALSSIFTAIGWGNSMTLISLESSQLDQGKSLGVGQSVLSLAQLFAPLFGGLIASKSIRGIFFVSAILVFISFILFFFHSRKHRI